MKGERRGDKEREEMREQRRDKKTHKYMVSFWKQTVSLGKQILG